MHGSSDHKIETSARDFENDFTMILLGLYPKITARKGFAGRRKLHQAINEYFNRGDHKYGLGVLKARHDAAINNGGTVDDVARFEIGDLIGVLVNATPTFFWMLLTIYSDPTLLSEIRAEIHATMPPSPSSSSTTGHNGTRKHIIDITALTPTLTPLLHSTFRELLRHRTQSSSSRWLTQDTLLANRYLLKKGSALLIPGALIHLDPIWGPDRAAFNARRFLKKEPTASVSPSPLPSTSPSPSPSPATSNSEPQAESTAQKPHPGAYRAWGGGQTLCPGRFFATTEITAAVAMVVMRFEMAPLCTTGTGNGTGNDKGWGNGDAKANGAAKAKGKGDGQGEGKGDNNGEGGKSKGEWVFPKVGGNRVVSSIHPPNRDVRVRVWEREGWKGDGGWGFRFAC